MFLGNYSLNSQVLNFIEIRLEFPEMMNADSLVLFLGRSWVTVCL